MADTLLEAFAAELAAQGQSHPSHESRPAVILWPDEEGQWKPLLPLLRARMPGLFTLGAYDPATRQGPAIWLRCVLERTLDGFAWPEGSLPVFYLPGVSRQDLRGVEGTPPQLLPMVELQHRGLVWTQKNGKDWTVEAFLGGQERFDLTLSQDRATRQALEDYLDKLAVYPLKALRGKVITVSELDRLMLEDAPRAVLQWLNDPKAVRAEWDANQWKAFCSRCVHEFGFSPEKEGERVAAEYLGSRKGVWAGLWERFQETPNLYPGMQAQLAKAEPASFNPFEDNSVWPSYNAHKEEELRDALSALPRRHAQDVDGILDGLLQEHLSRRNWVWARLGQAPLAMALHHLRGMREAIKAGLNGGSSRELARAYAEAGYRVDSEALEAAACVQADKDRLAIHAALKVLYVPWLETQALRFQEYVLSEPRITWKAGGEAKVDALPGEALVFVDGLRMDLAQRVAELVRSRGWETKKGFRRSPFPTVTGTAKACVLPGSDRLQGDRAEPDFSPVQSEDRSKATTKWILRWMVEAGYQILDPEDIQPPATPQTKGYLECGHLDHDGHHIGMRLVYQCQREVEGIARLIHELLSAGWRRVRVITDHGWLLVPEPLPKTDLPKFLSETKWSRCALVRETGVCEHPRLPWYWNPDVEVVYPKGIRSFAAGNEYAHGGISLQECVIPDFTFSGGPAPDLPAPRIVETLWRRLSLRLRVENGAGCFAELRRKLGDAATAISERRALDVDGKATLIVEDEDQENLSVFLVLIDASGKLLAKMQTIVGG